MQRLIIALLGGLFFVLNVLAQNVEPNRDPEKVKFVTSDIDNFWRAYDLASKETDREKKIEIYQKEYLDKGSQGLKDFTAARIKSAKNLVGSIESHPKYYASIRPSTLRVKEMEKQMRKNFRNLKKIYADAVFPDVFFTIGVLNSGGTLSKNGLLIGTEMYSMTPNAPREELNAWLKSVILPIENVPYIVAHESIHYQQKMVPSLTLIGKALQEGMCDFIAELIAGKHANQVQKTFGEANEAALWREFEPTMWGNDYTKWIYDSVNAKNRPADMGYYMGYKIVQSYYNNARDKRQAIRDILEIKDVRKFYETSKYGEKFGN
ncbi:MAG: DUF2268 domain-containing putative Zn-dependent protease [Acidobacteriota bacterium]|nr:DUF2268 domain-containing putative Zn-dependent protease [Acidobacteriota bacterium]